MKEYVLKSSFLRRSAELLLIVVFLQFLSLSTPFAADVKQPILDALNNGDTALAIDLLNAEVEIDQSYHMNYYRLGMIYFEREQYPQAREQFEIAVDNKSNHFESLHKLGLCLLELEELDKAEKVMDRGRKKAKDEKKAPFEDGYGLVMLAKEQYQEADRAFRAALILDSAKAMYHIHLGDANFYQGIPSLAIIEYEKALAVDTGSLEVYYHWAEACLEMKDYSCAINNLHIVLQKDSTHTPAWMRAGGIYFKAALSTRARQDRKARFKEAIGSYKRYLELSDAKADSAHVRVFFELAMAYVNVGGSEEAVGYFDKVLSIPYEPRDIYFHYGKALWGTQDFEKSGQMLNKHIEWIADPDNAASSKVNDRELYQYLGDSYYYRKSKNFRKAIEYYRKSIEINPNQKRLVYNIAVSYHNEKYYAEALEFYQKRIDLGIDTTSRDAGIYKNAGYCALNIANKSDEVEEMEVLEEDEGVDAFVPSGIDPNLNYYEVAIDYMEQYLSIRSEDAKVLLLVANTYLYQLADCTNGTKYFRRLLKIDPKSCDAKKALGYAYFGGICTKNYTKALGFLKDAYSCVAADKGACSDKDLVLWIAQCYHLRAVEKTKDKAGSSSDYKNANEWYTKCLKCDPSNQVCKKGRDDTSFEF
ncbi:MAG: tetratricopeptide repeat protein [candidate division Zixibacteria bacterium]|nr:tetratricopeptide repeat protein [candidate division Zixibacteria bacterium]